MGNKINKFFHSKLFIIILVGVLMITTALVGTYAWFTWSSTDNTVFNMTIGQIANVTFEGGNAITGNLNPVFNYSDGLSTSFSIDNQNPNTEDVPYSIVFNITSIAPELSSNASDIKYAILKGGSILQEGDLSGAEDNKSITLYTGKLDTGVANYVIYLYIDANVENDSSMMNKTLSGNIMVVDANEKKGLKFGTSYNGYVEGGYYSSVFYEDGSAEMYVDGNLIDEAPVGFFTYTSSKIIVSYNDKTIATILDGGEKLNYNNIIFSSSPLRFGVGYVMEIDGNSGSYVLYEDGSAEGYLNGALVESVPAGTLRYTSSEIINAESGEVMATILDNGEKINFDGMIFSLIPLRFSRLYVLSVNPAYMSVVFNRDGGADVYSGGVLAESAPAGMFAYTSSKIIETGSGQYFADIQLNGKRISSDDLILDLCPLHFNMKYTGTFAGANVSILFRIDGSAVIYGTDGTEESAPAGTFTYTSSGIVDASNGGVFATISSDGITVGLDGIDLKLSPIDFT